MTISCRDIETVAGCSSNGTLSVSVSIHYEYRAAASGATVIHATRYSLADGSIYVPPVGFTVKPGVCGSNAVPTEPACISFQVPGPNVNYRIQGDYFTDPDTGIAEPGVVTVSNGVTSVNLPVVVSPGGYTGSGIAFGGAYTMFVNLSGAGSTASGPNGPFPFVNETTNLAYVDFVLPGPAVASTVQKHAVYTVGQPTVYLNDDGTVFTTPAGFTVKAGQCPFNCLTDAPTGKDCNSDALLASTNLNRPRYPACESIFETRETGIQISYNYTGAGPFGATSNQYNFIRAGWFQGAAPFLAGGATVEYATGSAASLTEPTAGWTPFVQGTSLLPIGTWVRITMPAWDGNLAHTYVIKLDTTLIGPVPPGGSQQVLAPVPNPQYAFVRDSLGNLIPWRYNGPSGGGPNEISVNHKQFGPTTYNSLFYTFNAAGVPVYTKPDGTPASPVGPVAQSACPATVGQTAPGGSGCGCDCPPIPAIQVTPGGVPLLVAGPVRSATPAFAGTPATVSTTAITGKLQSFTVTARGVTDGGAVGSTPNQIVVGLPGGTSFVMLEGQSFSWSVARDNEEQLVREITVTATGNAYANIGYTRV